MKSIQNLYRRQLNNVMATREIGDLSRDAVVFAPHPDDETLGCGGTIIRKKTAGADVKVVFLTDGSRSHAALMPEAELSKIRRAEALRAAQALGLEAEDITFLGLGDGRIRKSISTATDRIRSLLAQTAAREIFVPYALEPPPDHAVTYKIVTGALSELSHRYTVYAYPIWYWQHWPWTGIVGNSKRDTLRIAKASFRANLGENSGNAILEHFQHAVYIGDVLEQKYKALSQHASQMERLKPNWPILNDVAQGDFLACFFQDYEIFHNPYEQS